MAELGNVSSAEGALESKCDPLPSCVVELWKKLEATDSRLSAIESSIRELQDGARIWSNITQEGLADLSMQVKAVEGRVFQKQNLGMAMENGAAVSHRLFTVEKRMQAMQTKVEDSLDMFACLSKTDRQLQEMQSAINEMQFPGFQDVLHRHDKIIEDHRVLHSASLPLKQDKVIHLESSQDLSSLPHYEKQQEQMGKPSWPQPQAQQTFQAPMIRWQQQRQGDNKSNNAHVFVKEQTAANHVQQHSGIARNMPSMLMATSCIASSPGVIHKTRIGKGHFGSQDMAGREMSRQAYGTRGHCPYGCSLDTRILKTPMRQVSAPVALTVTS